MKLESERAAREHEQCQYSGAVVHPHGGPELVCGQDDHRSPAGDGCVDPAGTWDVYDSDIAIASTDGTVTPIYDRAAAVSLNLSESAGVSNATAAAERSNTTAAAELPGNTTTYYLSDQINSTRMMLAAGGGPMSSDTYYPYGVEASASSDQNHYKFSGKERDAESGNDYFGARYYAGTMGRFLSPDWSASPEPVPYAKLDNPQSLNLYAYANDNPITGIDPDGHAPCGVGSGATGGVLFREGGITTEVKAHCDGNNMAQQQIGTNHHFKTTNQAATSALNAIFPTSEIQHVEYGGRIYKNANGTYSYTTPVTQKEATEVDVDAGGPVGSRMDTSRINLVLRTQCTL